MSNYKRFEIDFIVRTVKILEQYEEAVTRNEQYEVTLLINCLLGLLVFPREYWRNKIPRLSLDQLTDWGLRAAYIADWGERPRSVRKEDYGTLREVVHRMRNGVAHLRITPTADGGEIAELQFTDENGFRANVPAADLRRFAVRLAGEMLKGEPEAGSRG